MWEHGGSGSYCSYETGRGLAGEGVGTRRLSETRDGRPSPYLGEWKKLGNGLQE